MGLQLAGFNNECDAKEDNDFKNKQKKFVHNKIANALTQKLASSGQECM